MSNILRRTYEITSWATWDDVVHTSVEEFRGRFGLAPNILMTSEVTMARIDMAARKEKLRGPNGERAEEGEHTPVFSFTGPGYELDFCVDELLPTGRFSLLWDDDPDGGDEEDIPDEDTKDEWGAERSVVRVAFGCVSTRAG